MKKTLITSAIIIGSLLGSFSFAFAVSQTINLAAPYTWSGLQSYSNATSTLASFSYASSTSWYGGGLTSCNSASNALTWNAGLFGCNTITGGGSSYDWKQALNTFSVNSLTPTTTIPIWIQSTATSTFAGGIESWSKIGAPYFVATSTNANNVFMGNVGIATTSPASTLTVNGHIGTDGLAPALTSCGTSPSIVAGSTDTAGEVTEGSLATGCTITFKTAYARAPFVTISAQSGLVFSYTISASAITITNVGALSSTKLDYHVISNDL